MTKAQELIAQIQPLWDALRAEITATPPAPAPGLVVRNAAELSSALLAGGAIELADGSFVGNFFARKPVTLKGKRTAVVVPLDPSAPPLTILSRDSSFAGFTVRNGSKDRETVVVGDPAATTAEAQPDSVTLDGLSIEAGEQGGHRGISLHGSNLTVRNCSVTGFWEAGRDSQAVWINNGPGPYTVEDCYLEASGETILSGGASIAIPNCVPSDIVIRRNTIFKPDAWRTNGATVKNSVEIKAGLRVLIENNVIDGNWKGGQDGTPILFTVRNQDAKSPWVIVDQVTLRGNVVRRCADGFAVAILGSDDVAPSLQTKGITIERNVWRDCRSGLKIVNGVVDGLIVRNNTMPLIKGNFLSFFDTREDKVLTKLVFVNNVVSSGAYGISSADFVVGVPTLNAWAPGAVFVDNVIELSGERTIQYPLGNRVVTPGGLLPLLNPTSLKLLDGTAGY